jgi:hypothetical protein
MRNLIDGKKRLGLGGGFAQRAVSRDRQPPVLGDRSEAYNDSLMLFDMHALEISRLFGDRPL